jgi:WD40 repeat protein
MKNDPERDDEQGLARFLATHDVPRTPEFQRRLVDDLSGYWTSRRFGYLIELIPELKDESDDWGKHAFLTLLMRDIDERTSHGLEATESFYSEVCPERKDDIRRQFQVIALMKEAEIEADPAIAEPPISDSFDSEDHDSTNDKPAAPNLALGKDDPGKADRGKDDAGKDDAEKIEDREPAPQPADIEGEETVDVVPRQIQPENADENPAGEKDKDQDKENTGDLINEYTVLVPVEGVQRLGEIKAGSPVPAPAQIVPQADNFPIVPHHRIIEELGRGAFGRVYRATELHPQTQEPLRDVAVKIMMGKQAEESFEKEIKIVAGLQHPGIVRLFAMGRCQLPSPGTNKALQDLPFFSMELVEGGTLGNRLQNESLTPQQIAEIMLDVAKGLAAAHDEEVSHCDLKPPNILLTTAGEPKLSDFGLATKGGLPDGGSYGYMAPEVAMQDHDEFGLTADIYSMGAIIFEMLTGRAPLTGKDIRALMLEKKKPTILPPSEHLQSSGKRLPKDFRSLEAICMMCLSPKPADRYSNGSELADDLSRFLKMEDLIASPVGWLSRKWLWAKRQPVVSTLLAVVLVVSVTGGIVSSVFAGRANAEKDKAIDAHRESLDRNVQLQVATGWLQSELNGLAAALPSNAEAIRILEQNPYGLKDRQQSRLNRIRYAAISNQVPQVESIWKHERDVTSLAVSKDGRFVASTSLDSTVVLWDRKANRQLHKSLTHPGRVNHAAFSPDGKWLATACQNLQVQIWNVGTGQQVGPPLAFGEPVVQVAFSPDGTKLAACGGQRYRPYGPPKMMKVLLPGPGGKMVERNIMNGALPPYPGRVMLWNTKKWQAIGEPLELDGCIVHVEFNSTGTHLLGTTFSISSSSNVFAGVWQVDSLKRIEPVVETSGTIMRARFTPDGNRVIALSSSQSDEKSLLNVLDLPTGTLATTELSHQRISSFDVSADGEMLVTASLDNTAWVWKLAATRPVAKDGPADNDVENQKDNKARKATPTFTGYDLVQPLRTDLRHIDSVLGVRFSQDGHSLATICQDGVVRVWDLQSPTRQPIVLNHSNRVGAMELVDEHHLVCGSDDGRVRVWELRDGSALSLRPIIPARDKPKVGGVGRILFADDATLVGFLGYRRSLINVSGDAHTREDRWLVPSRVFRANITERFVGRLQEPGGEIRQISSDARYVVSITERVESPIEEDKEDDDPEVGIVNPDLESESKLPWTVYVWDSLTSKLAGKPLRFQKTAHDAFLFDDNKRIAVASSDNRLMIYKVSSGKLMNEIPLGSPVHRVRITPNNQTAVVLRESAKSTPKSRSYELHMINLATKQLQKRFVGLPVLPTEIHVANDSKLVAAVVRLANSNWRVVVVRAKNGEVLHQSISHGDRINSVTIGSRNRRLITASSDRTARIWDIKTGKQIGYTAYHQAAVNHAILSRDGKFLATSARDGTARVWEVATGEPLTPNLWHHGEVWQSVFSPNSQQLATASNDGAVRLWDLQPDQRKPSELMQDAVSSSQFKIDDRGRSVPVSQKELNESIDGKDESKEH